MLKPSPTNIKLAFKIAHNSDMASETLSRALNEKPNFKAHPDNSKVLLTETPASLLAFNPPAQAMIWDTGFPVGACKELLNEYSTTLKAIFTLKHGNTYPISCCSYEGLSHLGKWAFHTHDHDTPELMHFTSHDKGLALLASENEQDIFSVLKLGKQPNENNVINVAAGQLVNFFPGLVHSGPSSKNTKDTSRNFALAHISMV